jgi:CDP-glycerol glycerophosphotransferase (TagB/SpsB family)
MFEKALKVWKAAAQSRPDIAFILRSHRGKRRSDIEQKIAKVCEECPNIIRSERHYGIMAMATINDVMALVDCVISHPSTTILDAVYEGKPVAVMNSFQRIFECLPNVDTLDNFTKFIEDDSPHTPYITLRKTYGNLSDNLDIAASIVEQQMDEQEFKLD